MAQVSAGSTVEVVLTASTGLGSANSILQQVSQQAASDGVLTVKSNKLLGSLLNEILGTLTSLSPNQPFQVDMFVQTNIDFSSPDDVGSSLAAYFQQASGNYPSSISVVSIDGNPTGEASPSASSPGGSQGVGTSIVNAIESAFSSLTSSAWSLLIGAVAIIVLVLVLIGYSPNVKSIAAAV